MSFYEQKFTDLLVSLKNSVLTLTLNRPTLKNAFSIEMIESLVTVLNHANFDSTVRVVIVTGAGDGFCSGGDLKEMNERSGMFHGSSSDLREHYMKGIQQLPLTFSSLQVPTIAMVNGAAVGAGCDLALMCDFRIAATNARFGETFSYLNLAPGTGGAYNLVKLVGLSKAMEIVLLGKIYSAEEFKAFNLVNEVVPLNELKTKTDELVQLILSRPPLSIKMTKRALQLASEMTLKSHLELISSYQAILQRSNDHFEALDSMKEKRAPKFTAT
ncbi:MAG: enoyl-CoA hydratase-related protein [Bacteriovoracaceae bacterium]